MGIRGHGDTRAWGYEGMGIRGHGDMRAWGYEDMGIRGHGDTRAWGYEGQVDWKGMGIRGTSRLGGHGDTRDK